MAYQYSNAAREIASIKRISTRNLLMVLASAVDSKTGTCFHSVKCLMHWSQLSKGTFYQAVEELEKAGVLKRQRRRKGNRTNLWTLDIKVMESKRISWDSIRPKDAAPEVQHEDGDSGQGLPKPAEADDAEIGAWANITNRRFGFKPGSGAYFTLSKVKELMEEGSCSFERVREVVETLAEACKEGRIHEYFPKAPKAKAGTQHMGFESFSGKWKFCVDAYDRVANAVTVSNAFDMDD